MPLKPDRLERSLSLAQKSLQAYEEKLNSDGVAAEQRKKNPKWRELNANCQSIQTRIQAAQDLQTRSEVETTEEITTQE